MHRGTAASVSSSTLEWVDVEYGEELPAGAVKVSEDGGAWCRIKEHGHLAGVVRDGKCFAPFFSNVISSEKNKYEALVSINGSTRLKEIEWSRPSAVHPGGLQVSKNRLLALVHTSEGTVLPGYVDLQNRRATTLNGDEAENHEEAVILSEEEPVRYEMDSVVWDEARAHEIPTDEVLYNLTLENPAEEDQEVSQSVEYTVSEEIYWGNVRGTVKGVSAAVTGPGGQVWEVTWGIVNYFKKVNPQIVKLQVPAGAAVDVKLVGVMHKFESPYTGQLTSVYKDEERLARTVTALHHHLYLAELRADYGHPRSLKDGSQLDGEYPTSEVLIASTTTTTTTTTTPPPPGTDPGPKQAGSVSTPETSPAPALPALPSSLLAFCLALLLRLARP